VDFSVFHPTIDSIRAIANCVEGIGMNYAWDRPTSQREEPADFGRMGMFVAGVAAGAGLMYLLDPRGGARRRALIRDKFLHAGRSARMFGGRLARRARNEVLGELEERKAWWRERGESIDDDVLVERVRAQLGHVLSHPGAIEVMARDGIVTLRGSVVRGEIRKICDRLDATRGIRNYSVELSERGIGERIQSLQRESRAQRRAG
jgi:hypothetical protein